MLTDYGRGRVINEEIALARTHYSHWATYIVELHKSRANFDVIDAAVSHDARAAGFPRPPYIDPVRPGACVNDVVHRLASILNLDFVSSATSQQRDSLETGILNDHILIVT